MYFLTAMEHLPNKEFEQKNIEAITIDGEPLTNDSRCFGFYEELEDALTALKRNSCFMDDGCYHFLIVEYIDEGIHSPADEIGWFEYIPEKNTWDQLQFTAKNMTNFAIG